MVVIPTSTHVYMHYEASLTDRFFYLLTLIGIVLLVFWRYRGDVVHANSHPFLLTTTDLFDEDSIDWTPAEGHVLLPELPPDNEPPPADAAPAPGEDAPTEDPVDGRTDEGSFLPPGSV